MRALLATVLALSVGAVATGCIAAPDGASKLHNDPFDPHRNHRTDRRAEATAAVPQVWRPDLRAVPQVWRPDLRAVLVAGDRSMVDVGGIIVKLGGEVDGFRLVEVRDRKAVFVKSGTRLTLSIDRNKEP